MIGKGTAERVIDLALAAGADFCEIFLEDRKETNIDYNGGAAHGAASVHQHGAGIYLLDGTKSIYVYGSDTAEEALLTLVRRGTAFLNAGVRGVQASREDFRENPVSEPNPVRIYPGSVRLQEKIRALAETECAVKSTSPGSLRAEYTYFDTDQSVLVASSDGTWAEDRRVTTRVRGRFAISSGGETAGDWTDYACPRGFEALKEGRHHARFIEMIRDLRASLEAEESPKGRFPVVFESEGCVGTFFHEACGHQLETTNMQAESAYFRDKLGKKVASDCVTLIDDGTIPGLYGSSRYDDEGQARQKNILIENGVLKSFLADRLGSRQFGVPMMGCGRRQNYTYAPAARMSNTYLAAGTDDPDEMIRDIDYGILAAGIGGGTGGEEFTLNLSKAFLIRNGEICQRLKNAMLVGRGDETMLKIDRVAREVVMEESGAFCGASSGLVNTTTSGPRMRVTEMVIG